MILTTAISHSNTVIVTVINYRDALVDTPYAPLEYPYQECRKSNYEAMVEQAGDYIDLVDCIAIIVFLLAYVLSI